jgi:hypothetical protein
MSVRVLILHKYTLSKYPYRSWVGPNAHLTLFCPKSELSAAEGFPAPDLADYDDILSFDSIDKYQNAGLVELDAIQRNSLHPFDRVIATFEFDMRRAAQLRDLFGVPGQNSISATAYRDKFVMKSCLRSAGIPVADFLVVDTVSDLVNAFNLLGPKIVVKPRWGAGSVGVAMLDGPDALRAYIMSSLRINEDCPANLIAERFVEHTLHHVDGFILGNDLVFASASRISSPLDYHIGKTEFSVIHDWRSPIYDQLVWLTSEVIRALPKFDHGIVHAEIFETYDGKLVFNEIGARMGGARIRGTVHEAFGIDLVECAVRAQMGQSVQHLFEHMQKGPKHQAGYSIFRPREGQLAKINPQCPFKWATDYQLFAKPGDKLSSAKGSADYFASVIATGSSSSQVETRLKEFEAWFWKATQIETITVESGDNLKANGAGLK